MLTAAAHGKLKRKLELHEDEVTSSIFGEMEHLPTEVIWRIFNRLVKDAGIKKSLFCEIPDTVEFEFWPRWPTGFRYVEPDLVVHFGKGENILLHIIVEVKWGGQLNPPCELIRQWSHRKSKRDDDAQWLHLYLVRETAMGRTELECSLSEDEGLCEGCDRCEDSEKRRMFKGQKFDASKEWRERVGCVGWRHFVVAINNFSQSSRTWREGVPAFFDKQGIVVFIGFKWLSERDLGDVSLDEEIFFRLDPWFGFLNKIEINCNEAEKLFFVRGKQCPS